MSMYLTIFGKPRYLGLMQHDDPHLVRGEWIVVETMRGLELSLVGGSLSTEQEERYRLSCREDSVDGHVKGGEPTLQEVAFVRETAGEDLKAAEECRADEDQVLVSARNILRDHGLPMKLVDVEFILDKKKLFFYFTSEQRVDFRAYVRDLAKEFKTRIELRQIGVRDEAKAIRGLGPCGSPCCCSYWLHRFTPICIRMVKEQNLALNPTKISGICGRLMCCMSFEHPIYNALWKSLPNPGSKIPSPDGTYILDGVDLSMEAIRIRCPGGKSVLVKVSDFPRFKETVLDGRPWEDDTTKEREYQPARRGSERQPVSRDSVFRRPGGSAPVGGKEGAESSGTAGDPSGKTQGSESPAAKKRRRRKKKPARKDGLQEASSAPAPAENPTQRPGADSGGTGERKSGAQRRRSPRRRRSSPKEEQRGAAADSGSQETGER